MMILAIESQRPGATEPDFTKELLEAEAARAWELYRLGVLREFHFRADTHEAVLLMECCDAAEARWHLSDLPLVRAGLIEFEVMPLAPYTGFARLFKA
jgi:hypothetical protein